MNDVKLKDIYITIILITINILLFAVPLIIYGSVTTDLMVKIGAQYWPLIKAGEWWRLITCNFLHFSAGHLMSNMIMLFALGSIMEPCLGHARYTILYLLSGIGGSSLSYFVNVLRMENIVAAGASTSVYGLLGAMACVIFLGYGVRIGIYLSKKQFVLLALLNIAANILGERNIDFIGHIGGLISGILIFIVIGSFFIKKQGSETR